MTQIESDLQLAELGYELRTPRAAEWHNLRDFMRDAYVDTYANSNDVGSQQRVASILDYMYDPVYEADAEAFYDRLFKDQRSFWRVAEVAGQIVGLLQAFKRRGGYHPRVDELSGREHFHIEHLFVAGEHKDSGVDAGLYDQFRLWTCESRWMPVSTLVPIDDGAVNEWENRQFRRVIADDIYLHHDVIPVYDMIKEGVER